MEELCRSKATQETQGTFPLGTLRKYYFYILNAERKHLNARSHGSHQEQLTTIIDYNDKA